MAWNYCAAPGLAFTGGAHGQGDSFIFRGRSGKWWLETQAFARVHPY